MQSLQDLALTVSEKKVTLRFFQTRKHVNYLPSIYAQIKDKWYIHDLLDVVNNRTKFQLNLTKTSNFQLKLSGTAVTLQYNQGHWNQYEWLKLDEQYHHAKLDLYYIYSVRKQQR